MRVLAVKTGTTAVAKAVIDGRGMRQLGRLAPPNAPMPGADMVEPGMMFGA